MYTINGLRAKAGWAALPRYQQRNRSGGRRLQHPNSEGQAAPDTQGGLGMVFTFETAVALTLATAFVVALAAIIGAAS